MRYIYVLQSKKDKDLYIGCTKDLKLRLVMHNSGKVFSTKERKPFILIYYEAFLNQKDAFEREQWLKTGWGHNQLYKILANYFKNFGGQV